MRLPGPVLRLLELRLVAVQRVDGRRIVAGHHWHSAQLSKASTGLAKVRGFWNRVETEVGQAGQQTWRTHNDLYPAESDTEETDNSRTGSWAASSLGQIEQSLSRIQSDSSTPTYALYEVKQQLSAAQSNLSKVDAQRLPTPWRYQETLAQLNTFQSQLYRIEQAQQQLQSRLADLQSPISQAGYQINAVANDREGVSVATSARTAGSYLSTLSQHLQQVEQHLRFNNGDLTQVGRTR